MTIACSLSQADHAERRRRWTELRSRALLEARQTDGGLRLVFRGDDGVEAEVHELAALERDCCGFARWEVSAGGGRVVLEVEGESEPAQAATRQLLPSLL